MYLFIYPPGVLGYIATNPVVCYANSSRDKYFSCQTTLYEDNVTDQANWSRNRNHESEERLDLLKREDLEKLLDSHGATCVSIYLPTHRVGREQQQDRIRLKNLITRAAKELKKQSMRTPEIESLLNPVDNLLVDPDFWQHQSDGLAIFLNQDFVQYYRLPYSFEELLRINHRFHIKPLLPLLSRDCRFFILSLSKKDIQLFQATRFAISEVDLSGIHVSMEEALQFDDPEKQLQFHTGTASPAGRGVNRPAVYHGHGAVNEEKTNILRFFQLLNNQMREILAGDQFPLVLAGVDYLHAIYREANTYSYLVDQGIKVNSKDLSNDQLHKIAWDIVSPIFTEKRRTAMKRYLTYAGENSQMATDDLALLVEAAYFEAVDTLFVPVGMQKWGTFDPQNNNVILHDREQVGDTDLLDFATMHTLKNSGNVYALSPEDIPGEGYLAAIFRYEYEQRRVSAESMKHG